jgi:hypothetical protein
MELLTYNMRQGTGKIVEFMIEDVQFKNHDKLIINDIQYHIEFYAPTWTFSGRHESIDKWNQACGSVRCKRYKNLHYKNKTTIEKLRYLIMIMKQDGCYILKEREIK